MPLFWLSLAFLLGIAAAPYLDLPAVVWLALAGLFLTFPFLPRILRGRPSFFPSQGTGGAQPAGRIGQSIERLHAHLPRLPYVLIPLFFSLPGGRAAPSPPVASANPSNGCTLTCPGCHTS